MSAIRYVHGDMLKGNELMMLHGCNSFGVMGSGIALQIKRQFPEAVQPYFDAHKATAGRLLLGEVYWGDMNSRQSLGNCITQIDAGADGKLYANYHAIYECLYAAYIRATECRIDVVAMPLIGCGLAGGSWRIVSAMIETIFNDSIEPVVYLFDGKMPTT